MASKVLAARYPSSPGNPATAPQSSGATTASEAFSARDSTVARATSSGGQLSCIAPHEVADLISRGGQILGRQLPGNRGGLPAQRPATENGPGGCRCGCTVAERDRRSIVPAPHPARPLLRPGRRCAPAPAAC